MNSIVSKFENIKSLINNSNVKIIAVTKTFSYDTISPIIDHGHLHFGENKVQEAQSKWTELKKQNSNINLHMIGRLQSNKAKPSELTIFNLSKLKIFIPPKGIKFIKQF